MTYSQGNTGLRQWLASGMHPKLLIANAAVFLLIQSVIIVFNLSGHSNALAGHEDLWLATSTNLSDLLYRPWSVITHMFTHVAFSHFLWNMVWLYFAGRMFEQSFGSRKMLSVYLVGGLFGFAVLLGITQLLQFTPNPRVVPTGALGASASIMAVFIALAVHMPEQRVLFFGVFPVRLKYLAIVYVLLDYMALRGEVNVGGHLAHLGGAAFGLLFSLQIKKGRDIVRWAETLIDRLAKISFGNRGMRTVHRSARTMKDEDYNAMKRREQQKVDAILDKIAQSGYDSLSKDEKDFLFRHSKRN
jgi:membrane associated rhomboid family serine protease